MDVIYCNSVTVDINAMEARLLLGIETADKNTGEVINEPVADVRMNPQLFISMLETIRPQLLNTDEA